MKNTGIKSKRRITSIITIILTVMMLSGCINNTRQINVGVPKGAETNDFLTAVNRDLDPDVIKYDGIRPTVNNKTKEVDYDYIFMIQDTKGNIGDEVRIIYDIANDAFKEPEFRAQKTSMIIATKHFQPGVTNYVVSFSNYDKNGLVYDHIYSVYAGGIDRMTEDYDPSFGYEINDLEYWDSFVQSDEFIHSDYIE